MATCEKCWRDAHLHYLMSVAFQVDQYHRIVRERESAGIICTPEEQCGDVHVLCVDNDTRCRCGLKSVELPK